MYHSVVIMFIFAVISISHAQNYKLDNLNTFAEKMNFTFNSPDGYTAVDADDKRSHSCLKYWTMGSSFYTMQNTDKSIIIAFRLMNWNHKDTIVASQTIRRRDPEWTVDYDYLHYAKKFADTIKYRIVKLPE